MSNNEKQIGVKVDASLWKEFRDDVKSRRGSIKGHLKTEVNNALREYIQASKGGDTHDRLVQIEKRLEEMEGTLTEIDETKKDSSLSSTMENRMAKIRETIHEESDGAPRIHEQVVEMAIKKHAGKSKPTIRQYKDLLQQERDVFSDPRPDKSYFFIDAPNYCKAVNQMLQECEIDKQQYLGIVEDTYNREWWGAQVDKFENRRDNSGKGFQ